MDEYIEKNLAIEELENLRQQYEMHDDCDEMVARKCKNAVLALPVADVALVVHGVPIRKNRESREVIYLKAGEENGEILYKRYVYVDKTDWVGYCPVCGKRLCSRFNNYCPNCGAKMDL